MLVEATTIELRPDFLRYAEFSAKDSDVVIITMKESGSFGNAFNINMDDASVAMQIGTNSAFVIDNYYVFGGQSFGYKTLY